MLRLLRSCRVPATRFFSEDFILEDSEESVKNTQNTELIRLLPVAKHPIFPKHYIRFKLSSENFKFLVADSHSNYAGAFVLKPKADTTELETNLSLLSILPIKGIDQIYSTGSLCQTSFNKFDRTIVLKPLNRTRLLQVVEPISDSVPFPLVKVEHIPEPLNSVTSEEDITILKLLTSYLDDLKSLLTPQELTTLEMFAQRYNMRYDLESGELRRSGTELHVRYCQDTEDI